MSAAPTSAPEPPPSGHTLAALQRAGWPVEAILWERRLLAGLQALAAGDPGTARDCLSQAQALADGGLPADDLRQVTAVANLAILDNDASALARLAARWTAGADWLMALRPGRHARSSTFHLRLEAKHPGGYGHLHTARLRRLWQDGAQRLERGLPVGDEAVAASRAVERARAAAKLGLHDERKLATAALLILS